mgnify:CR=1 FL=1
MKSRPFICRPDHDPRTTMALAWREVCQYLEKGLPAKVLVGAYQKRRSLDQNAKLWAMLTDISVQVEWPVDGRMQRLPPEDWKEILTAGLNRHQRIAAGVDGGFVSLGARTSRMTVAEMKELLDFVDYFGGEHEVQWSELEEPHAA